MTIEAAVTEPAVEAVVTDPTPQATPWYDGADVETVGYLKNRGLDTITASEAALKTVAAHRAAESKLGVPADQLVRLPKGTDDVEGQNALWAKLGRPEAADGYALKEVPGVDDAFVDLFSPLAHKAGLTKQQAQDITRELAEITSTNSTADVEAAKANAQVEQKEVTDNWGQHASSNALVVEKAFDKLGFTTAEIGALTQAIGYKNTMDRFLEIGKKLGEDVFIQNELPGGPSSYSREGAAERISQLKADEAWSKSYMGGDANKIREFTDLHRIAYG